MLILFLISDVCLFLFFCLYFRHTLVSSVWWSTPTRTCPFIRRTSLRCTEGRKGMKCLHTSTPSLSQHTAACSKVWQIFCLPEMAFTRSLSSFCEHTLIRSMKFPHHIIGFFLHFIANVLREVGFIVYSELNCSSNWEKIVCKLKSQLGRICNHRRRSFDWNVYLICSQLANTGDLLSLWMVFRSEKISAVLWCKFLIRCYSYCNYWQDLDLNLWAC